MTSPQDVCYFQLGLRAVWKQTVTQGNNNQQGEQHSTVSSGHSDPSAQHYAAEMLEDPVTPASEITLEWTHYVRFSFFKPFLSGNIFKNSVSRRGCRTVHSVGEAAALSSTMLSIALWTETQLPKYSLGMHINKQTTPEQQLLFFKWQNHRCQLMVMSPINANRGKVLINTDKIFSEYSSVSGLFFQGSRLHSQLCYIKMTNSNLVQ